MGSVGKAVTHAATNIVNTVKTVVTHPSKANIGQIASVLVPISLTVPVDAAQHKEDRPILAVATTAAIGGAWGYGAATAAGAAGGAASIAAAGVAAKSASAAQDVVQTVPPPDMSPAPTLPPFLGQRPIALGSSPPSLNLDHGVWSSGGGGGWAGDSGNVYANPSLSGTTTPAASSMPLYLTIAGALGLLFLHMSMKKGR